MRRFTRPAAAAFAALALLPGAAPPFDLASRAPLSDEELAEQRGGFTFQGLTVSLGAEIRTYLDGALVLQTNVNWNADGATTTQAVSADLTPATAAQLQAGILASGAISMRVGEAEVYLANQGQTAIMHRVDGALQNILLNTASNVSARQEVDATLDLGGYGAFNQMLLGERMGMAIGDMVQQTIRPGQ